MPDVPFPCFIMPFPHLGCFGNFLNIANPLRLLSLMVASHPHPSLDISTPLFMQTPFTVGPALFGGVLQPFAHWKCILHIVNCVEYNALLKYIHLFFLLELIKIFYRSVNKQFIRCRASELRVSAL